MTSASVHQTAKFLAALLRVAGVTAGVAESNGSLPQGLWLTSPAGWLPRTGIRSGTLNSAIEYGLPLPFTSSSYLAESVHLTADVGSRRTHAVDFDIYASGIRWFRGCRLLGTPSLACWWSAMKVTTFEHWLQPGVWALMSQRLAVGMTVISSMSAISMVGLRVVFFREYRWADRCVITIPLLLGTYAGCAAWDQIVTDKWSMSVGILPPSDFLLVCNRNIPVARSQCSFELGYPVT